MSHSHNHIKSLEQLLLNRLFHNILEHTAHHVDPRIPLYNLPDVQARLESVYPSDILVERLTPFSVAAHKYL